jgi:Cu+-exporting ATPase
MKFPIFYVLMLLIVGCNSKSPEKKTVSHNNEITETISDKNLSNISFPVEGMTCEVGCAARIEKKVAAMGGVASTKVDFEAKTAYVSFDSITISFDDLKTTIESLGDNYKVGEVTSIPAFSSDQK